MTTFTPEQRQEIQRAGEEPVLVEDPETRIEYVILKAELYKRLQALISTESLDPSETYRAVDRAFAEGWSDPKMAEYDKYESQRP